jgi:hypothetical protein
VTTDTPRCPTGTAQIKGNVACFVHRRRDYRPGPVSGGVQPGERGGGRGLLPGRGARLGCGVAHWRCTVFVRGGWGLSRFIELPRREWQHTTHTTRYPSPAGRRAAAFSALQRAPARLRGTHGRVTWRVGRAGPGRWWASYSPTAPRRICRRRRPPRPRLYDRRRTAAACTRPWAAAGLPSAAEGGPSQTGWSRRAPGLKWPALQQRPSFLRPVAGLGRRV